jgi:hypothetical protein
VLPAPRLTSSAAPAAERLGSLEQALLLARAAQINKVCSSVKARLLSRTCFRHGLRSRILTALSTHAHKWAAALPWSDVVL